MIEAGQQEAVRHVEHLLAADFRLGNRAGGQHAQFQHHLEQQILRRAVGLDVIRREGKQILPHCVGRVVDVLHVGGIQPQAAEAAVKVLGQRQPCVLTDFLGRPANALLADFADILVAGLVGFGLFIAGFR